MPSPSWIRRSKSDPHIPSSSSKTKYRLPPSSRSACSTSTSKLMVKLNRTMGNLISITGRKSCDSGWSKHSDLTEENVEAHNRREVMSKCSPYYTGLTDASKAIHRERTMLPPSSSPGRESHATTNASSASTSFSFLLVKMHEWTSCFSSTSKSTSTTTLTNSFSSLPTTAKLAIHNKDTPPFTCIIEKPLRERVSAPTSTSTTILVLHNDNLHKLDEIEKEFTWANKYQPKSLTDFICNRDKAFQLQLLMKEGELRHLIFEGLPGVGKRTMMRAMLREACGSDMLEIREACLTFDLKGESVGSIQVKVKESCEHVEVNLSDLKGYEKHVIVELMKGTYSNKAIILCEADRLSTDAVLYIKWLLERYKGGKKVLFCCSDASKLQPIKTLCALVQLLPPSTQEIVEVLEFIARQEGIELPNRLAEKIVANSKNNLRQAIRSFEATWQMSYPFKEDQAVLTGWEEHIANIAKNMVQEQSPKQLYNIRGKLQNLIEHDLSPEFIFKSLVKELKELLDEHLQLQIDNIYEEYNRDDGRLFDRDKPPVFARSGHEEMSKRLNDPMRKNVQYFLRIEDLLEHVTSTVSL